jgi:predicted enzyme related to lactoylglutathione lyase
MIGWTREGQGVARKPADFTFDVAVNDIYHEIATVTVDSPVYREYLHLTRTADGWKILNAIYMTVSDVTARARRSARIEHVAHVWSSVTIDCLDPARVARFWSTLLGREPGLSQNGWVYLGERGDAQPRLVFQPVSEPAAGKVRIHLDITVDDIENAKAEVIKLGGAATGERHDYDEGVVVVMADPEGHEFCLVQYYE